MKNLIAAVFLFTTLSAAAQRIGGSDTEIFLMRAEASLANPLPLDEDLLHEFQTLTAAFDRMIAEESPATRAKKPMEKSVVWKQDANVIGWRFSFSAAAPGWRLRAPPYSAVRSFRTAATQPLSKHRLPFRHAKKRSLVWFLPEFALRRPAVF